MLNRTLIRLKAVQMLYAYLLTRSEFRLLPPPEKMTRDNKVAYDLYLDFLLMILQLSGFSVQASRRDPLGGLVLNRKINGSKMAKSLAADDNIRDIINLGNSSIALFDNAIPSLYRKIADSEALKEYSKIKSPDITDDIRLWVTIVRTIFAKDQEMIADARKMEDFTQTGYDRAITMVVDTLNNYNDAKGSLITARKNLEASLAKSYELYFDVFALMVELTHEQERRLQAAKEKYLPTAEDLNPNMRFVNNKFIAALENNEQFVKFMEKDPVNWNGDIYLIRDLLDRIVASEYYKEYMNNPEEPDFAADCELWRHILKNIIVPSDAMVDSLEARSVFWNDDLDIMATFVSKTIRQWAVAGNDSPGFLPMYKDSEDAEFGVQLFTDIVNNRELYRSYLDKYINTTQWDPDRLAFMDIVLVCTIISELLTFPQIPIPVTLNEYLDIANRYSTPKSSQFINGIIASVIKELREEGKLMK